MMIETEAPQHIPLRGHFGIAATLSLGAIILTIIALIMSGCSAVPIHESIAKHSVKHPCNKRARITYYTDYITAIGKKPVQGRTIAAHPSYAFHKKVVIPQLYQYLGETEYEVQDRGRAVTSRKASNGTADVFDIYVKNSKIMNWLKSSAPEYMTVEL